MLKRRRGWQIWYKFVGYYLTLSKGPEINFILNKEIAFEVKNYGTLKDIKKLSNIAKKLKMKKYYLITKNYLNENKAILPFDL